MNDWKNLLLQELKRDEGMRLKAYPCTSGVWTVGYGATRHKDGRAVRPSDSVTKKEAEDLLKRDLERAIGDARKVCACFEALDGARKAVISNLAFNLGGPRLALFQRTLRAVCEGRYADASKHMLSSLWAKQVGNRAKRLAERMKTGEW